MKISQKLAYVAYDRTSLWKLLTGVLFGSLWSIASPGQCWTDRRSSCAPNRINENRFNYRFIQQYDTHSHIRFTKDGNEGCGWDDARIQTFGDRLLTGLVGCGIGAIAPFEVPRLVASLLVHTLQTTSRNVSSPICFMLTVILFIVHENTLATITQWN